MLIILDGPDGSGKTTLAQWMKQNRGLTYRHFSRDTTHEDYFKLLRRNPPVFEVWDRCWASAFIYQRTDTGTDRFKDFYEQFEEIAQKRHRAVLVMCLPSVEVAMENWARKQEAGEEKYADANKVRNFYMQWKIFRRTDLPVIIYNYQQEGARALYDRALSRSKFPHKGEYHGL